MTYILASFALWRKQGLLGMNKAPAMQLHLSSNPKSQETWHGVDQASR